MSVVINGTGSISGLSNVGGISSPQSGTVLQVVNATYSSLASNSTNVYADTGLTATITPLYSTSKILIEVFQTGLQKSSSATNTNMGLKLFRNGSQIVYIEEESGYTGTLESSEISSTNSQFSTI